MSVGGIAGCWPALDAPNLPEFSLPFFFDALDVVDMAG